MIRVLCRRIRVRPPNVLQALLLPLMDVLLSVREKKGVNRHHLHDRVVTRQEEALQAFPGLFAAEGCDVLVVILQAIL